MTIARLQARVRYRRVNQMRRGVNDHHQTARRDDVQAEHQVAKRRGQKHEARQAEEKMQHRVQVADALSETEPAPAHRIVDPEYLRHAARPAHALSDMYGE